MATPNATKKARAPAHRRARARGEIAGDGTFAVAEGRMALAPGSSGWTGKEERLCP